MSLPTKRKREPSPPSPSRPRVSEPPPKRQLAGSFLQRPSRVDWPSASHDSVSTRPPTGAAPAHLPAGVALSPTIQPAVRKEGGVEARPRTLVTFTNLTINYGYANRASDPKAAKLAARRAEKKSVWDAKGNRPMPVFFTDGSFFLRKGQWQGSYAIVYRVPHPTEDDYLVARAYRLYAFCEDNNQAELMGIAEALATALPMFAGYDARGATVKIFSDSTEALKRIALGSTRFHEQTVRGKTCQWEDSVSYKKPMDWLMQPVVRVILDIVKKLGAMGVFVELSWMKRNQTYSHRMADSLAGC